MVGLLAVRWAAFHARAGGVRRTRLAHGAVHTARARLTLGGAVLHACTVRCARCARRTWRAFRCVGGGPRTAVPGCSGCLSHMPCGARAARVRACLVRRAASPLDPRTTLALGEKKPRLTETGRNGHAWPAVFPTFPTDQCVSDAKWKGPKVPAFVRGMSSSWRVARQPRLGRREKQGSQARPLLIKAAWVGGGASLVGCGRTDTHER